MSSLHTLASGLSWVIGAQIASQLIWYLSLVVVVALVSPTAFGTIAAATVIMGPASLLMGSGSRGEIVTAKS